MEAELNPMLTALMTETDRPVTDVAVVMTECGSYPQVRHFCDLIMICSTRGKELDHGRVVSLI